MYPNTVHSFFSAADRVEQTRSALGKLVSLGFQRILLFDNSDLIDENRLRELFTDFPEVEPYHHRQYQFRNKGISEALLLLNNMHHLPDGVPIFKISGRYAPNEEFKPMDSGLLEKYEVIGIGENFDKKTSSFNTRAYYVKNKAILTEMLVLAIEEILSYAKGIHGLRSLCNAMLAYYRPAIGISYQLSLEQAFARILKYKKNYLLLSRMNIEGYVAGSRQRDFIKE